MAHPRGLGVSFLLLPGLPNPGDVSFLRRGADNMPTDEVSGAAVLNVATIPPVLTADETCSLLKISRVTLWHCTRAGTIRAMRIGRTGRGIRFAGSEIARYMNDAMGGAAK